MCGDSQSELNRGTLARGRWHPGSGSIGHLLGAPPARRGSAESLEPPPLGGVSSALLVSLSLASLGSPGHSGSSSQNVFVKI